MRSLLLRCVHAVILDGSGAALVPSDAELAQRAALLQTAVDVGCVVASGLVAELPELGGVSPKVIAAWVGQAHVRGD